MSESENELLQIGFFRRILQKQNSQKQRSYVVEVVSATIVFFICFSVITLFSPSIAVLSPVYNFSTTQSSVLIALPTVTATLVRIPLSVSTIRFGTIAPIILSQSVAMFGLFALVIVIFFAPVGPEMFGVFCFLALVIGVAGSVFPLCFLQVSFWTPKAHQGLACAAFIGIGAMGTSVFTLVLPFLLNAIGLGFSYLIWFFIQLAVILYIWLCMRNPPYLECTLEARRENVEIVTSWGQQELHEKIAPQSQHALSRALDLGDCEFEVVLSEEKPRVLVGAEEIQRICSKQEVFSKSDLIQSLKLSLKNWRVWVLFVVQFSTFGGGVSSLSIWGPTFFRVSFGTSNSTAAIITFAFGICCSVRVFFGPIFDRISVLNGHLLGFFSALVQGLIVVAIAFVPDFGGNIALWMISGIFYGFANTALFFLLGIHEPRAQSGAIGIASSGIIGGAVFSALFGPIVSSFPPDQVAFATRFCLVLPGAFCCVASFAFLLLLIPKREEEAKRPIREQTFVGFVKQ